MHSCLVIKLRANAYSVVSKCFGCNLVSTKGRTRGTGRDITFGSRQEQILQKTIEGRDNPNYVATLLVDQTK